MDKLKKMESIKIMEAQEPVHLADLHLPEDLRDLSYTQCRQLCREIRTTLVNTVSKTGGHLASNLGVVELTMALHRCFHSPEDKIVWDVGHQSYTHKLLTGRLDRFSTLRQENGISGFPKPSESEHDAFVSGHSSTSISVACGMAASMRLNQQDHYAVAVIGDGAMTGGMVYEGLNNGGKVPDNLIVILNDNHMSISKNVGALAKYLASIRGKEGYVKTKWAVERTLDKTPVLGKPLAKVLKTSKDTLRNTLYHQSTLFDNLGFVYLGPVNGHNLEELEEVLQVAKSYHRPVLVHVNTVKGKGYMPAEKNPGEYHGISKFDVMTGNPEVSVDTCFSTVFGQELARLGREDQRICAITAAMKYGTGLQFFASECRDRFFDVGIAEQHAVTFAASLASMGHLPVFAVYSSFLQRAYDQLLHDVAISNLHVVLGIDRAGIIGEDGETHQGLFDVSLVSSIPNSTIYSPLCYEELCTCLKKALYEDKGLVCIRYPRGVDQSEPAFREPSLTLSHYRKGGRILLVTYGRIFNEMVRAQVTLAAEGICCDMLRLTRIFPLLPQAVVAMQEYDQVIFFEEGVKTGGIASQVGDALLESGFRGRYSSVAVQGFVKQASVAGSLEHAGLSASKMSDYVKGAVHGHAT